MGSRQNARDEKGWEEKGWEEKRREQLGADML